MGWDVGPTGLKVVLGAEVPDLVKLADAMGCVGYRCERAEDVDQTLDKAFAVGDAAVLVDFRVDPTEKVFPFVPAGGSNDDVIEHVLLATDEEPEARPRTTDYKFRQSSRSKGYRATYEIFNDHYLEVRIRRIHAKLRRYIIDPAFLATEPVPRITIDWPALTAALAATVATALLMTYLHYAGRPPVPTPWFPVAIVTGTAAGVVGLFGRYRPPDKLVFHSQHGGAPLLELINRGRGNNEFQSFLQDITERTRRARAQHYGNDRDLLGAELREHRRLKEEAVISEDRYEAARSRILHCHGTP